MWLCGNNLKICSQVIFLVINCTPLKNTYMHYNIRQLIVQNFLLMNSFFIITVCPLLPVLVKNAINEVVYNTNLLPAKWQLDIYQVPSMPNISKLMSGCHDTHCSYTKFSQPSIQHTYSVCFVMYHLEIWMFSNFIPGWPSLISSHLVSCSDQLNGLGTRLPLRKGVLLQSANPTS